MLPLFQPFIEAGEIANLPSFNFYIRIAALQPQEPMSGETLLLEDKGSPRVSKQVRAMSRKHYAAKYEDTYGKRIKPRKSEAQPNIKKTETEDNQPLDV